MRVLVVGSDGVALSPCHPARARQLLKSGRATVEARDPFTIRLLDRVGNRPARSAVVPPQEVDHDT